MKIMTRDFGEVEVNEQDVITFKQPIFGFDDYTRFIILYDDQFDGAYVWLQSLEEKELCFILANPSIADESYNPKLNTETLKQLGEGEYEYWLVMVVADELKNCTVNLKSPIVINLNQQSAVQVILDEAFPIRFHLFDKGKEEN